MPPDHVIEVACDVFFLHCHNQPYTFFHEASFRQRLADGLLPDYLLFAFLASAMRFSQDSYFEGQHLQAGEEYASRSWTLITSSGCAIDEGADTSIVQAVSLLSIIDSAG